MVGLRDALAESYLHGLVAPGIGAMFLRLERSDGLAEGWNRESSD